MERVIELATKLVKLCGGQPDEIVIKAYCQAIHEEINSSHAETSQHIQDLDEAVQDEVYKYLKGKINSVGTCDKVVKALLGNLEYVNLLEAKGISQFYGRIPKDSLVKALKTKEILGILPQFKEITFAWDTWDNTAKKYNRSYRTRKQPLGEYAFNVKSLMKWLESNFTCNISQESLTYSCINKLLKSK